MLTKVYSTSVVGIEADIVEVEADVASGLPNTVIVGLPDTAVKEARERVRTAIKHSGAVFPVAKIAVNLAPADLPKNGTHFDLPIALAILANSGQLQFDAARTVILGELALDGTVRPVPGVLPAVLTAREKGFNRLIVPAANAAEAALVRGVEVFPVRTLNDVIAHLQGTRPLVPVPPTDYAAWARPPHPIDMRDIKGQEQAKRALEIAAAGAHNVLLSGPPGSGKTMLARTFATILPQLTEEEALEVTKIYSVVGGLADGQPIAWERPFRSPHHTASAVSLVGGGSIPRPGEITLAHRGVLFLDEFPEFSAAVLESLRQPLEDGIVTIARATGTSRFPARFMLVAAQNPCPCGYLGDPVKACTCSPGQIERYAKRLSGPLLDRIDLHVSVPRMGYTKIAAQDGREDSATIRARVEAARAKARARFAAAGRRLSANAEMTSRDLQAFCPLDAESKKLMQTAVDVLHISTRAYFRVLKIARTIADLAASEAITSQHVSEALQYRPAEA